MSKESLPGTVGYVTSFVESYAQLFTVEAYSAYWKLLLPHVNPYGWGLDFWYHNYSRILVPNHKLCLMSDHTVVHRLHLGPQDTADGKSDAIVYQEIYFSKRFNVNLSSLSSRSAAFSQSDWFIGYVYPPEKYY